MDIYVYGFAFAYSLEWLSNLLTFDVYKDKLSLEFHEMLTLSCFGSISSALAAHLVPKLNRFLSLKTLCLCQILMYLLGLTLLSTSTGIALQLLAKVFCGFGSGILFSCYDLWLCLHVQTKSLSYKSIVSFAFFVNSFSAVVLGIFSDLISQFYWLFACVAFFTVSKFENHLPDLEKKYEDGTRTPTIQSQSSFYPLLCCQVCFECAITLFVYSWQNIYILYSNYLNQSKMFSILMLTSALSSVLCKYLEYKHLKVLILVSLVAFCVFYSVQTKEFMYIAFLTFECCIGTFFPIVGAIREQWSNKIRARYQSLSQVLINITVVVVVLVSTILNFDEKMFITLQILALAGALYFSMQVVAVQVKNS
eukprot:NODE_131_length_18300_cov_0.442668.p6 type:complete len:365 gc:universal NODE_131_length_18300_cov_0.442668:15121-16215(+)